MEGLQENASRFSAISASKLNQFDLRLKPLVPLGALHSPSWPIVLQPSFVCFYKPSNLKNTKTGSRRPSFAAGAREALWPFRGLFHTLPQQAGRRHPFSQPFWKHCKGSCAAHARPHASCRRTSRAGKCGPLPDKDRRPAIACTSVLDGFEPAGRSKSRSLLWPRWLPCR